MDISGHARRIFLSHSHQDNEFSRRLVEALRSRGLDVWYDESDLSGGSTMDVVIESELRSRDAYIVVLSPAAVSSRWVRGEWNEALELHDKQQLKYFIPVIAAPCDIPLRLKTMFYIDFTQILIGRAIQSLLKGLGFSQGEIDDLEKRLLAADNPTAVKLPTLWDHAGTIQALSGCFSITWSPDGKYIVSGSRDKKVRIWDVATKQCVQTFTGHENWVDAVAWSPDGKYIVSASEGTRLRVWNVDSGTQQMMLTGHTASVKGVAWSPDGHQIVSGAEDMTIRIWDAATGQQRQVIRGPQAAVTSVDWSPDINGNWVGATARDAMIRVWNADTGAQAYVLSGHNNVVHGMRFSPSGHHIASVGNTTVRVWDVHTGEAMRKFEGHKGYVVCVAWRPDGMLLATGSADHSVRLWSLNGERIIIEGATHGDWVHGVAWSPDGMTLASCGGNQDGTIRLWQPA